MQHGISQIQSIEDEKWSKNIGVPLSWFSDLLNAGIRLLFTFHLLIVHSLLSIVFHMGIGKADFSSGQRPVVRMGCIEENRKMTPESSNKWYLCAGHCCATAHAEAQGSTWQKLLKRVCFLKWRPSWQQALFLQESQP